MDLIYTQIVVVALLVAFLIFMAWSDYRTKKQREAEDRDNAIADQQNQRKE